MYSRIFTNLGAAFATLVTDRLVQLGKELIDRGAGLEPADQQRLTQSIESQALAAAIFAKYGISGVKTAYNSFGIISIADFAYYVVLNESWRLPAVSDSRIQQLEAEVKDESFFTTLFGSGDEPLASVTTNPDQVARMYFFLLANRD